MITLKTWNDRIDEKDKSSGEGELSLDRNNKHVGSYSPKSFESRQFKRSFHTNLSFRSKLDTSNVCDEDLTVKGKKWWLVLDKPMQNSQSIAMVFMKKKENRNS